MFNTVFFHTVLAFLALITNQLSAQLTQDINLGNTTLDPQILDIKKEISGGGTIDLIDATTQRIDGICSFDKNTLQIGRAFVFDQMALNYATNEASGKEGDLSYNEPAPAALLNSLVIISQNGREIVRMPFCDVHNVVAGQKVEDQYTQLKAFRYIADAKTITIQLKFAPGTSLVNTEKHYVYLRLNGVQTSIKS
jgi:hypothetical protein